MILLLKKCSEFFNVFNIKKVLKIYCIWIKVMIVMVSFMKLKRSNIYVLVTINYFLMLKCYLKWINYIKWLF